MKDGFCSAVLRDKGLSTSSEKLLSQTKEQTIEANVMRELELRSLVCGGCSARRFADICIQRGLLGEVLEVCSHRESAL